MEITDIKFRHTEQQGRLRALVSVTFDRVLAVHDIKIISGHDRLFLAMPSRRMPDGRYRDIVHPVGSQLREILEERVLGAYQEVRPEPFSEQAPDFSEVESRADFGYLQ